MLLNHIEGFWINVELCCVALPLCGEIPDCKALHILSCTQCFEGMKAYRGADDKIRLFRPMENMNRMKRSAVAASLPVSFSFILLVFVSPAYMYIHVHN